MINRVTNLSFWGALLTDGHKIISSSSSAQAVSCMI